MAWTSTFLMNPTTFIPVMMIQLAMKMAIALVLDVVMANQGMAEMTAMVTKALIGMKGEKGMMVGTTELTGMTLTILGKYKAVTIITRLTINPAE